MHNGTDTDVAAIAPPDGVVPDFDHPYRYLYTANKVVVIIGLILSTICLLIRGYARIVVMRKLLLDDVVLVVSWLFSVATQALLLYGYRHTGIGIHEWDLLEEEYIKSQQVLVAGALLYAPAMALSKLAIIALYYRFSELRTMWKATVIGLAIFVICYLLVIELFFLFGCRPITKTWNDALDGTCVNRPAVFMSGAVASVITDIMLLAIPIPIVMRLQMARRKKVWIFMMLALGSLSVITSILRIVAIVPLFNSKDQTFLFGKVSLWINVEANLVIICAALPSFRQAFRIHDSNASSKGPRLERSTSTYQLRGGRRDHGFTNLSTDHEMDDSHPPSRDHIHIEPIK